jgi:hypothetical protein
MKVLAPFGKVQTLDRLFLEAGAAGAGRLVPGTDNLAQSVRDLTRENQKPNYLPKVVRRSGNVDGEPVSTRRLPNLWISKAFEAGKTVRR